MGSHEQHRPSTITQTTAMQSFDIQRFTSLLKHDITENRKSHLRFFGGVAAGTFLVLYCFTALLGSIELSEYADLRQSASRAIGPTIVFLVWALGTLSVVAISHIFSNMGTKQSRLNFLMLPATNLEKYACRWLQHIIMAPIGILLAFVFSDALCALLRIPYGFPFIMGTELIVSEASDVLSRNLPDAALMPFILLGPLSLASTFVLGGTIFRRVPFIMTNIAIGAINLVMSCVMGIVLILLPVEAMFEGVVRLIENSSETTCTIGVYLLLASWIVFCHWLSFRIFCRSSVIGHKNVGM